MLAMMTDTGRWPWTPGVHQKETAKRKIQKLANGREDARLLLSTTEEFAEIFLRKVEGHNPEMPQQSAAYTPVHSSSPFCPCLEPNPPDDGLCIAACARAPPVPLPEDAKLTMEGGDNYASIVSSMRSYEPAPSSSGGRSPTSQGKDPESTLDQAEVLTVINQFRREHGAPYLQWSETCAREAQKRASHRSGAAAEFGENLARSTSLEWRNATTACVASIQRWQREEAGYDYTKPGLSSNTDHFTNNVWKLTTHVGFGVSRALYKGKSTVWVVAYFFPKGNQAGDFARNVLPRGSVYDGDDNMVRLAIDDTRSASPGATPPSFVRVTTVNTEVRSLRSKNGNFRFQVLPDRNIVVRRAERIIWSSGSRSTRQPAVSSPFRLVLQKNGDLVAYDSSSRAFWSSETANCGPAPYTLTLKDDGNCVLFDGRWVARWATVCTK